MDGAGFGSGEWISICVAFTSVAVSWGAVRSTVADLRAQLKANDAETDRLKDKTAELERKTAVHESQLGELRDTRTDQGRRLGDLQNAVAVLEDRGRAELSRPINLPSRERG